jgi:LysM repeat protein
MANEYKLKSYNFNDSTWIRFADIQQKLPILKKTERASSFPKSTIIQKQDSLGIYLIKIEDLLTINDIAPINYVSSNIKQMILHKRKQELLKKIEETLVTDAIKNKQFEEFK